MTLPKMGNWVNKGCPPFKYAHGKLDGHFMRLRKYTNIAGGISAEATSKKPVDITEQIMQYTFFRNFCDMAPDGADLYGELYIPGKPASQVKPALIAGDTSLRFHVFASPTLYRVATMSEVDKYAAACGQDFARPWFTRAEVRSQGGLIPLHAELPHLEGFVLKDGNLHNWLKYKKTETLDLAITDLVDGRGKNIGLIGSFQLSDASGRVRCNCNLKTDAMREDATLIGMDNIGKIVEVAFDYIDAKGKLRFPRFVRYREDKTVADTVDDSCL